MQYKYFIKIYVIYTKLLNKELILFSIFFDKNHDSIIFILLTEYNRKILMNSSFYII